MQYNGENEEDCSYDLAAAVSVLAFFLLLSISISPALYSLLAHVTEAALRHGVSPQSLEACVGALCGACTAFVPSGL
jgi:hypothetical protein